MDNFLLIIKIITITIIFVATIIICVSDEVPRKEVPPSSCALIQGMLKKLSNVFISRRNKQKIALNLKVCIDDRSLTVRERSPIPHICHFFTLTHFQAWKFFTQKRINLRQKLPRDKTA